MTIGLQPDLFDVPEKFTRKGSSIVPPTREEVRRVRRSDPQTSKAAAASVVDFGASHYARILLSLRDHGPMTVCEIAAECAFGEQQVNKRLPEMQRANLVAVLLDVNGNEVTRKGGSGRRQRVWRAV